jgi:peptidyl-prolyl cis-trans isomerase D
VEGIVRDQKKAEKIKITLKGNSIEAIASNVRALVQNADSLSFANSIVPGIGNEPKIIGASFNKALINKTSSPIVGNSGVFVISVNNQGAMQAMVDFNLYKEELLNRTRSSIFRSNASLKKIAKIEDNRFKLY